MEWQIFEDDYIEKYYLVKSDEEIAKELNKTKLQVHQRRLQLGFKKQRQTSHKEKIDGMKWCWYCTEYHSIDDFSKNKSKVDGCQDECRKAVKELSLKRKALRKKKENSKITEKLCCQCNKIKGIHNFIKNVSTNDGYTNSCRECLNEDNKIKKYIIKGE